MKGRFFRSIVAVALIAFAACDPIVGTPPLAAPINDCSAFPCNQYVPSSQSGAPPAICNQDVQRCESGNAADANLAFVLVVDVPTTSFFAPGRSFVVPSSDLIGANAKNVQCRNFECIAKLPATASVTTSFFVTPSAAGQIGIDVSKAPTVVVPQSSPAAADPEIGARARWVALSPDANDNRFATDIGIPMLDLQASFNDDTPIASSIVTIAPGRWLRTSTPSEDALPTILSPFVLTPKNFTDAVVVGDTYALDDPPGGKTRVAHLSRQGGLDGFTAWLEDGATGARISSARALTGDDITVRLDTVGQNVNGVLGGASTVNLVVAPPAGSIGVPTFANGVINGLIVDRPFPALPPAASVSGQVLSESQGVGVRASIVFESQSIAPVLPDQPVAFLRYVTTLETDAEGRYATVLPPGAYQVFITPSLTSGLSRLQGSLLVNVDGTMAPTTTGGSPGQFSVPEKTRFTGAAVISDGRPLAYADVIATPAPIQPDDPSALRRTKPWHFPRPERTTTDASGRFTLVAEEGTYDIAVVPQLGTGFGTSVTAAVKIGPAKAGADSASFAVTVRPPVNVSYTLRDPATNPVREAIVRAFAHPSGQSYFVEIGQAMTDLNGRFEILLGPQP